MPLLLCEFQREHPDLHVALSIWDTQTVSDKVAERELELGVVGALRRNRSLEFEPLVRDEIVLAVPPGHPAAGRTVSLDDLREETLIAMQEGAGVRQVVDEELRRAGLRVRELEPKLELGLQESVKSAVAAGFGVTFISRTAIEGELAAGTLAAARVAGIEPARQIYVVRAKGRAADPRGRGLSRVRAREDVVIVRWGLDALPAVLAEVGIRAAAPRHDRALARRSTFRRANAFYGVEPHGSPESVAEATRCGRGRRRPARASGAEARSTRPRRSPRATGLPVVSVPTTYSGAEWTRGFGIRDEARRVKGGGGGARVEGIVYEPELTLRPAAWGDRRHRAERARPLRRGALRRRDGTTRPTREALAGAPLISDSLPLVLADGRYPEGRRACSRARCTPAPRSPARASGSGTRWRRPSAAATASRMARRTRSACRPRSASTWTVAGGEIARFGEAMRTDDPVARVEELARLSGFTLLRHLGVPQDDLPALAEAAAERGGAKANPRPASADDVLGLYESVW